MDFTSWIDQQVREAEERGTFDNLPGAGKPIPHRDERDYVQTWLRDYLRREGVPADEMLPAPLKLRKETERLAQAVPLMRSEQEVRAVVASLNRQIMDWRRNSVGGPPIFVPLVNEEKMAARWREAHPVPPPGRSPAGGRQRPGTSGPADRPRPAGSGGGEARPGRPSRWRRLRWRRPGHRD